MTRWLAYPLIAVGAALLFSACNPIPPPVKQIAAGRAHACALDSDIDGIKCWGDNSKGQTTVPALTSPRFVATGGDTSCAIANGAVECWGDTSHGEGTVPALTTPTALVVGDAHVCAIANSKVVCWGDNSLGQTDVPLLANVKALTAGSHHTCAIATGGVKCWGDNSYGQLDRPPLTGTTQISAGGLHTCAITLTGIKCWGGDIPALSDDIPTTSQPTLLASGRYHSCVLDANGVQCWGDTSVANTLAPRNLTNVSQLVVGGGDGAAHACVHHQQGIACWGDNNVGQTNYNGVPYHIVYRSESEIDAAPADVWAVLMDLENYPLWNPFTIAMNSTLQVGDAMNMKVKMNELLVLDQTEYIRVLDHVNYKACWGINTNTPAFNTGERCQWLESLPNGGTRYITEDLIEGTQTPTVISLFGNSLTTGFNGVATGLKARAEALYSL
jgi:hypothetical protein